MDTLSRIRFIPACYNFQLPRIHALYCFPNVFSTRSTPLVSVLRAGPQERELNGDFVSRASDILWQRKFKRSADSDITNLSNIYSHQTEQIIESNSDDGFLKLSRTQEWVLGDKSAPINKKVTAKMLQDSSATRKILNILKYESLKREILLLSVGIGFACSGYCLITLSLQAAVSYAIGVLFSCFYLWLLYQHADNLSSETVPQIFTKKKSKIGIRSEDLQDLLERSIKGCSMSLPSPRLAIPAANFGLWVLSHQYFSNDFFDFQLVRAMFGIFVYKAAVLVQVYRDNEDLQFVFPENEDGSTD